MECNILHVSPTIVQMRIAVTAAGVELKAPVA